MTYMHPKTTIIQHFNFKIKKISKTQKQSMIERKTGNS